MESDHWRAWVEVPEAAREEAERLARDEAAPRAEGASAAELPAAWRAGAKTEPLRAPPRAGLVCRSPAMRTLSEALDRLRSTEIHVLIRGETGSGKELIARIIHSESRRGAGPFQVVDCAAVAEGVLDAELFGVEAA